MTDFQNAARAIVDNILEHEPIEATWAGVHTYDAEYPDVSAKGFAAQRDRANEHLATLRRYDPEKLDPTDQIDWRMLFSKFEVQLRELAELEPHKHSPSLYPNVAVDGIYCLLARAYAPLEARMPAIVSRLGKIPSILAAGRHNLDRAPAVWREIAIEETQGAGAFLRETVGPLAKDHPGAFASNLDAALTAIEEYGRFLRDDFASRNGRPFAVGRELFDFKLKREHLLDIDADGLLRFGERAVRTTQEQLAEIARQIDAKRTWGELVDEARQDLPKEQALLAEYQAGVSHTRRFVEDRKLASIPSR